MLHTFLEKLEKGKKKQTLEDTATVITLATSLDYIITSTVITSLELLLYLHDLVIVQAYICFINNLIPYNDYFITTTSIIYYIYLLILHFIS